MTFEAWLKKQKHREDAIGDLANDFIGTRCRTIKQSFDKYDPCYDAIKAYNRVKWEYDKFLKDEVN